MKKYYPGELVKFTYKIINNISIRTIGYLPTKHGKGKLPIFWGNGERVIPIYDVKMYTNDANGIYPFQ